MANISKHLIAGNLFVFKCIGRFEIKFDISCDVKHVMYVINVKVVMCDIL